MLRTATSSQTAAPLPAVDPVPVPAAHPEAEIRTLERWSIQRDASPYTAPELRRVCLRGFLASGREVVTSCVLERIAAATYRTHSGSVYRLEGEPEAGYVAWCAENSIDIDVSDPIRFV